MRAAGEGKMAAPASAVKMVSRAKPLPMAVTARMGKAANPEVNPEANPGMEISRGEAPRMDSSGSLHEEASRGSPGSTASSANLASRAARMGTPALSGMAAGTIRAAM